MYVSVLFSLHKPSSKSHLKFVRKCISTHQYYHFCEIWPDNRAKVLQSCNEIKSLADIFAFLWKILTTCWSNLEDEDRISLHMTIKDFIRLLTTIATKTMRCIDVYPFKLNFTHILYVHPLISLYIQVMSWNAILDPLSYQKMIFEIWKILNFLWNLTNKSGWWHQTFGKRTLPKYEYFYNSVQKIIWFFFKLKQFLKVLQTFVRSVYKWYQNNDMHWFFSIYL